MMSILSGVGRKMYRLGLWLLARRRWAIPLAVILFGWLVVQTGWLNHLGNAVTAGAISLVDSIMQVLIHMAGPLIALWLIWKAVGKIVGINKR